MAASTAIPCLTWMPAGAQPQAVLVCVHGLGLYGSSFQPFAERMAHTGLAVYALDVRGFGQWQKLNGKRCRLDFASCLADLVNLITELRQQHAGLPIFLVGESLGGAIATAAAAIEHNVIDGLILAAPARIIREHKEEVAKILWRYLTNPGQPVSISSSVFRHAPHVVRCRETDPLIRLEYSAKELLHLSKFLLDSFRCLPKLKDVPVLVLQGQQDSLITPQSTMQFFQQIPVQDKQLVLFGSAGHLILQAQDISGGVVSLVREWVRERSHTVVQMHPDKQFKRAS